MTKGVFAWLYSGIGINRIKTLFNLIGHNSCQVRRKTQPSSISRPSHYFWLDVWLFCESGGNFEILFLFQNRRNRVNRMHPNVKSSIVWICDWYCQRYLSLCWLHQSQHEHDHNVFSFKHTSICCEQKQSSTFHKFSGPKQQLISTKSTEKPSKSTEKPSEGAQNLIAIVLSLPHRDEDNICVRAFYWTTMRKIQ